MAARSTDSDSADLAEMASADTPEFVEFRFPNTCDRCYDFLKYFRKKTEKKLAIFIFSLKKLEILAIFIQTTAFWAAKIILTLVFKKHAILFAENDMQ
jgi:hypothetical protein